MRFLAADSASSLGQFAPILLIVVLFGALFWFQSRNRRKQQDRQQQMRSEMTPGTQVVMISGLKAKFVEQRGEEADLEIAPGVIATFDARAISRIDRSSAVPGDDVIPSTPAEDNEPDTDEAAPQNDNEAPPKKDDDKRDFGIDER